MAFPCLRIPPSKESCAPPDGNPKTQEIRHPHPAFLQNRLLAQVKSQRSINRFRILHGRLLRPIVCSRSINDQRRATFSQERLSTRASLEGLALDPRLIVTLSRKPIASRTLATVV